MSSKSEQRKIAKQLRLDMKKELYQAYSDTICLKIMNTDKYAKAQKVMAYCPINNEVDTSLLLEECIAEKELILPKTDTASNTIIPYHVDRLSDLQVGAYNILEPNESCQRVRIDEIDMIIVPMVAFDKGGTRLGYGGGYYDRLLKHMDKCEKIGIAFSVQQLEHIEAEVHDIKLDQIITEKKNFKF